MRIFTMTRAIFTLAGGIVAVGLLWLAAQIGEGSTGEYWASYGIVAGAGLVMALAQLFGGWTKFGWPRLSLAVFLLGFLPAVVVVGWILLATQPQGFWEQGRLAGWSSDIGILGAVRDVGAFKAALAFGLGLLLGFSFDTKLPEGRVAPVPETVPTAAPETNGKVLAPTAVTTVRSREPESEAETMVAADRAETSVVPPPPDELPHGRSKLPSRQG
jgi:hypothetical protein